MDIQEPIRWSWLDYTVFSLTLFMSIFVALIFGFSKNKPNTPDEYIFGGKKMPVIPILLSNIASSVSSISLIGTTREAYYYGLQLIFIVSGIIVATVLLHFFYLPVFYNLKFASVFEYLEKRFNKLTRRLGSIFSSITEILHLLVAIYSAGLTIADVFSIPFHIFTPIACLLCTIYTAVGGLRGVVWVDSIQTVIMTLAVIVFIIFGIIELGGFRRLGEIVIEGGRSELHISDWSPFVKYSPATLLISESFITVFQIALNQGLMQRYLSLSTFSKSKSVCIFTGAGQLLLHSLPVFFGLIIYATYHDCDPAMSKLLKDSNKLVTYYISEKAIKIPGFGGLFVAGILSASYSSMSTVMNSVSAKIFEDLVKPIFPWELSMAQSSLVMKSIVVIVGSVVTLGTLAINTNSSILQLYYTFNGFTASFVIFVFNFGLFWRKSNSKAAIIGGLVGTIVSIWLSLGIQTAVDSGKIIYSTKIVSIEGCSQNITEHLNLNKTTMGYRGYLPVTFSEDLAYPYRISFVLIIPIGFLVSAVVGFIVTLFTSSEVCDDETLLIPLLKRRNYTTSTEEEMEQLNINTM